MWHNARIIYRPVRIELTNQVKLATVVEGDPKAPFSVATTSSFPRIAPPLIRKYSAEC